MDVGTIISKLKGLHDVIDAVVVDEELLLRIREEESKVSALGRMEYDNIALDECYGKDSVVCMFCDGFFEDTDEITMRMEDSFGTITGHDVPPSRRAEFEGREDVIWVSDGFIMYPRAKQRSESRMVLLPRRFSALGSEDGVTGAISFYPSVSTDVMLKEMFLSGYTDRMTTLIVGFDFTDDEGMPRAHGRGARKNIRTG